MNFSWLLSPVASLFITGVGLLGSLAIWISAKIEMRAASKAVQALRLSTEAAISELNAQIERLRDEAKSGAGSVPAVFEPLHGLNLTTRTKVLRMNRRGEATSSIAAALRVPQEEVDLLLKLDRLLEAPARFHPPGAC